ncbi:MAG TPA: ABC transporter permease [Nocardioidaceae bacterium]|nr:ABC transporter permease [Nocardioidaceae bacterium]
MSDVRSTASQEDLEEVPQGPSEGKGKDATRGLWGDAWYELRRSPTFWSASVLVAIVTSMAVFPFLWTSVEPDACFLAEHGREAPSLDGRWFGYTFQGCDMWAQVVYGSSKSLAVAVLSAIGVSVIGVALGTAAGYYGGFVDSVIGRFTDVFFGLPFLLGALVFLAIVPVRNVWSISGVLIVLGWTSLTRIMRGSVLSTKNKDFVDASRALGASNRHIIFKHVLPNSIAPLFVLSTIYLGAFVSAEATLTYLGVGFQQPDATWGLLIQEGQPYALQGSPHLLIIPCAFVVVTVLAFILLGDVLRDALDPRNR